VTSNIEAGEYNRGLFGKQTVEEDIIEYSDSEIDGDKFSQLIDDAVKKLNNDGYRVTSITPITSGKFNHHANVVRTSNVWEDVDGAHVISYGYGYSYTEGVIILGEKTA